MPYEEKLNHLLELTIESGTDIKWLKSTAESNFLSNRVEHKEIVNHLIKLNGQVANTKKDVALSKWGIGGLSSVVLIIITILLHLMGIY